MAEAKNNFLGSKMNKDLEQRLVPNNEYRDANNVMISRSEGDDVGSLEIVLGNDAITNFGFDPSCDIEIIGYYMDQVNNRIFAFLTDYWDSSSDQLSNFAYGSSTCAIAVYNIETESVTRLVEGYWLNFSKTHPVLGVNLVEQQYLYFTDNRNQPRKINVNAATSNPSTSPTPYYTCEDQISVSKYYPYQTPLLIKEEIVDFTLTNPGTTGYTIGTNIPTSGGSGSGLTVNINTVNGSGQITDISIYSTGVGYSNGDVIGIDSGSEDATLSVLVEFVSTMTDRTSQYLPDGVAANPTYDPNWSGDKDFLKDKFVRFAYRFKHDDGEYSLISPFTQACFVPKQDGYFTGRADEVEAYTSTEVEFMENKINQIDLIIPSPYGTWEEAKDRFKISEIDIIFKRSDIQSLNVIESVKVSDPKFTIYESSNIFQYDYLSEKPYKTLPNNALLRVYDKVPVKALSQEFQENRIIYGNFLDKHTPPSSLDYFLVVENKDAIPESQIRKEYQNHTLKQNRTYQAGVVLSDRYGRQSSVILTQDERNSIFNPYKTGGNFRDGSSESGGSTGSSNSFSYFDASATDENLLGPFDGDTITNTWPGDQLGLTFTNTIALNKNNATGSPGLYNENGKVSAIKIVNGGSGYSDSSYTNLTSITGTGLGISITTTAGEITGVVINSPGIDFEIGDSIALSGGVEAVIEIIGLEQPNPLGWYSYKIVVKQTENEYYNVYHAGVLNGYVDGEGPNPGNYLSPKQTVGATLEDPTVHFALYGDNINKVPKDITLLGPNQNIFRTARPSLADDPSYYDFVDTGGSPFSVSPYDEEGQALLKLRDRRRDLDSGSQIQNAAVTLFPRVINFANTNSLPTPGNTAALFNKQWYPGTRVTTVTTIATGRELGLWDAAAPKPYNTAPVFYGYENNPLIAKATLEINKSISSANENWQEELDLYGANGPSPKAGKVIYNIDWVEGFTGGDNYIAGSKNINTKVKPTSSSIPTQGEDGQGIRVNIDKVTTGSTVGDEGALTDKGVSIANDDSDPNVKGFDNPDFTYPYYVQLQVLAGNEAGYIFLNSDKTEWPGFMQPYLSIHETQPIESKLDIYWETSTEGLIKDLNEAIINEDEFLPVRLGFNGTQNSSANFFEDLTSSMLLPIGTLEAYSADGNVINDSNVQITLLDSLTVNGNGTLVPGKFTLLNGPNNYTKRLSINTGQEFVYEVDPLENVFTITCNVMAPTPTFPIDGTFTNTQLTATINLKNVCPSMEIISGDTTITPQTYNQPGGQNCAQTSGTRNFSSLGTFNSATFPKNLLTVNGKNGSADTNRDEERVTFNQNASPTLENGYIRIFDTNGNEVLSPNWWSPVAGGTIGGGFAWTGNNIAGDSRAAVTLNPGFPPGTWRVYIKCSEGIAFSEINTSAGNDYLEFTVT